VLGHLRLVRTCHGSLGLPLRDAPSLWLCPGAAATAASSVRGGTGDSLPPSLVSRSDVSCMCVCVFGLVCACVCVCVCRCHHHGASFWCHFCTGRFGADPVGPQPSSKAVPSSLRLACRVTFIFPRRIGPCEEVRVVDRRMGSVFWKYDSRRSLRFSLPL
jgi:hypothetical protein